MSTVHPLDLKHSTACIAGLFNWFGNPPEALPSGLIYMTKAPEPGKGRPNDKGHELRRYMRDGSGRTAPSPGAMPGTGADDHDDL